MLTSPLLARSLTLFVIAASATAQASYVPDIGTARSAGDDTITASLDLGFSFDFPGGLSTRMVDVDSNGRILPAPGNVSDPNPMIATLLAGRSSICPLWADMDFLSPTTGDLHFNALPGVALFTWVNVEDWLGIELYSFQCQLHSDGRIVFAYDSRTPTTWLLGQPLVGVSPGLGAPNPGPVDLSSAPLTSSFDTVYEDFSVAGPFDLADRVVELTPGSAGGWTVALTAGAGFPASARSVKFGLSCPVSVSITPDGMGGFTAAPCGNCWDPALGTSLGMQADDALSSPQALGFGFSFPGGGAEPSVVVDVNGRLLPGSATTLSSDPTPSVAELLNSTFASIAPMWCDLDATVNGNVWFATGMDGMGRSFAMFSWVGMTQFTGTAVGIDVQARLFDDGAMTFSYYGSCNYDMTLGSDVVIGWSSGGVATDPGETDITAIGNPGNPSPIALGSAAYEAFDASVPEMLDIQLTTEPVSPAVANGPPWQLRVDGVPSGSIAAVLLLGFSSPGFPLALLAMPDCFLLSDASIASVPLAVTGQTTSTFSIQIVGAGLAGFTIYAQGAVIAPLQGITPLGAVFANGVADTIGF